MSILSVAARVAAKAAKAGKKKKTGKKNRRVPFGPPKKRVSDYDSGKRKIMVDGKEMPLKDYDAMMKKKKPDLLVSDKAKDMVGSARTKPRGIPPQRKGSVAKKANVSKSDIEQAKTKRALDAYENKVNAMKPGNIKTMLKKVIKDKRKAFENMQAGEKDKASRTASNAARSKKMKGKVTLAPDMNKGGMAKKK